MWGLFLLRKWICFITCQSFMQIVQPEAQVFLIGSVCLGSSLFHYLLVLNWLIRIEEMLSDGLMLKCSYCTCKIVQDQLKAGKKASKANRRAACFRWRQAPKAGRSERGGHGHTSFHFHGCCLRAVLCLGSTSHAGVKEGMQTEDSGMFTQPECFPQGEDAFLALQQGERSK